MSIHSAAKANESRAFRERAESAAGDFRQSESAVGGTQQVLTFELGGATDYTRGLVLVGERMVVLLETDSLVGTQMTPAHSDVRPTETAEAA
jgi:hypothetical protein